MLGYLIADLLILAGCIIGLICWAGEAIVSRRRFRRQVRELTEDDAPTGPLAW